MRGLFRAGDKVLPCFRQQPFRGRGARLQCVQPHMETGTLCEVLLFCFIKSRAKPPAFGIGFGKTSLDLAQVGARRGERVLAFSQPARQARGLVKGLVNRDLKGAFFVVQQREPLAHGG